MLGLKLVVTNQGKKRESGRSLVVSTLIYLTKCSGSNPIRSEVPLLYTYMHGSPYGSFGPPCFDPVGRTPLNETF